MCIPVAVESDDLTAPLLFQSPGTEPPTEWPPERRGMLQRASSLRSITKVLLTSPQGFRPGPVLTYVLAAIGCVVEEGIGREWSMRLLVRQDDGRSATLEI